MRVMPLLKAEAFVYRLHTMHWAYILRESPWLLELQVGEFHGTPIGLTGGVANYRAYPSTFTDKVRTSNAVFVRCSYNTQYS